MGGARSLRKCPTLGRFYGGASVFEGWPAPAGLFCAGLTEVNAEGRRFC
jgi:hypothetical protein